ncbi:MAG: response regulator [Candidatus Omnitrophica bacterium]|nr:response regulator [Candidatus Omnitrophota bacterium]MBU1933564.1 response regulator [Candidatus Omnitrophota bacterium]
MYKVLVIDDEESLLFNVRDFLASKGYTVFASPNGAEGISIVKEHQPDLILLDLHLKDGLMGTDVLRISKMLKQDIKVVIFTGFGDEEETRSKCMAGGADVLLSKPTSLKNIRETIENLLGKGK